MERADVGSTSAQASPLPSAIASAAVCRSVRFVDGRELSGDDSAGGHASCVSIERRRADLQRSSQPPRSTQEIMTDIINILVCIDSDTLIAGCAL